MATTSSTRIFLAGLLAIAAGCGGSESRSSSTSTRPGQPGTSYLVTVQRPTGGRISSGADGRIDCGSAPAATLCGPVSYGWTERVTLVATANAGNMFGTWVGDCSGRPTNASGEFVCVLDTTRYGADKFVGATFGPTGRTLHPNFNLPTTHGPEFFKFVTQDPDAFECTYCHGATYAGQGIAPSCNDCHARAGFPGWLTNCTFCHGAPPPPAPTGYPVGAHPVASSDTTQCAQCHPRTVDATGTIVTGGLHMNGQIEGGHPEGYAAPAVHGRDFFEFISGTGGSACTTCHGATYGNLIVGPLSDQSCNTCHAAQGWVGWQTNCSFCHGTRDATTKLGYVLADHPTWATPPDAISQRLTGVPEPAYEPVGAHAIHLTGSAFARPFACGICHETPSTLTHISGRQVRASVVVTAPGSTGGDPSAYDPATGTCGTTCHGASRSPAWTFTGLPCSGCHEVPPSTAKHQYVSAANLADCAGCHPTTIAADGTILPGGTHISGTVDSVEGHDPVGLDPFSAASVHGPQFLDYTAGATGAPVCTTCHGTALTYCTNCHSRPESGGWVAWQTNCTFCHGTRTPSYTSANLNRAAPPDAVTQRLTGVTQALRTGKHPTHLSGTPTDYPPLVCATCHPVPTTVNHVSVGPDRRAAMVFSAVDAFPGLTPAQYAALPSPLGTYDPATNRCSNYCHGSTAWGATNPTPRWSTGSALVSCNSCHGQPPPTGKRMAPDDFCDPIPPALDCGLHEWHQNRQQASGYNGCAACHFGSAPANAGNVHLNGVKNIAWLTPNGNPSITVTGTWDAQAKTCSAVTCHLGGSSSGAYGWTQ